jgi:hypothetical protein
MTTRRTAPKYVRIPASLYVHVAKPGSSPSPESARAPVDDARAVDAVLGVVTVWLFCYDGHCCSKTTRPATSLSSSTISTMERHDTQSNHRG